MLSAWKDKVALVTGASSGIGRAVAKQLALGGMKVVACARRSERLEALRAELEGEGSSLRAISCNLRDIDQIEHMFSTVRSELGGVDVLVNNAGLGKAVSLVDGEDVDAWREMLEVNVLALSVCTKEALKDMRSRGDYGHVIHISSMAAHRVPGGSGMYSASKYAVRALTEGLRKELRALGSQIRVTAISPGFVETEFAAIYHGDESAAEKTYKRFKVLESEDIAAAVAFALDCPPHMQVHDLLIRPTQQEN